MYSVCSERCKIRAEYSTTSILTVSCFANHPNHRNLGQFEAELIFALCTARVVKAGFPGSNLKVLTTLANEINFEALRCGDSEECAVSC